MPLNEADTRAQLIDPKLRDAGWTDSLITREHFYRRDHRYTAGRIYLVGDEARRRHPRRVDYLLRYTDAFPIAVVEAKDESHNPNAGLEQAKRYARELGLTFAYSSNGHGIVEYDFYTHGSRDLGGFPTPYRNTCQLAILKQANLGRRRWAFGPRARRPAGQNRMSVRFSGSAVRAGETACRPSARAGPCGTRAPRRKCRR